MADLGVGSRGTGFSVRTSCAATRKYWSAEREAVRSGGDILLSNPNDTGYNEVSGIFCIVTANIFRFSTRSRSAGQQNVG